MNKKGNITTTQIIFMAVFVVVLVIVLYSSSGAISNYLEKIGILTPTPNMTQPATQETQIFRFNIQTNKVQYYDGANVINFQSDAIEFKDKKINYQPLKDAFYNYYHGINEYKGIRKLNERTNLSNDFKDKVYNKNLDFYYEIPILLDTCAIMVNTNGDTIVKLISRMTEGCTGKVYGEFALDANNNLKMKYVEGFSNDIPILKKTAVNVENTEVKQIISGIAIKWRDSVFKNPINLPYTNLPDNKPAAMKTCVDKRDNYLIVDFNKPKETC